MIILHQLTFGVEPFKKFAWRIGFNGSVVFARQKGFMQGLAGESGCEEDLGGIKGRARGLFFGLLPGPLSVS